MIFTVAFRLLLPGDMHVLLEGGVSALPTTPLLWLIQPLSPRLLQVQLKLLLGRVVGFVFVNQTSVSQVRNGPSSKLGRGLVIEYKSER